MTTGWRAFLGRFHGRELFRFFFLPASYFHRPARPRHLAIGGGVICAMAGSAFYYQQVQRPRQEQAACVQRGVASFRQLGSYPVVRIGSDRGKKTVEVVRMRCATTPAVF